MDTNASKEADADGETRKRLITIHSQKGGVGKTLIGLYLARRLAQNLDGWKSERTVFIDADLTGTSVAEALPLLAPKEDGDRHTIQTTRQLLKEISASKANRNYLPQPLSRRLRFLNDILLCPPEMYRCTLNRKGNSNDFSRHLLLWTVDRGVLDEHMHEGGKGRPGELDLDRLRVIPSSGLPRHVAQCVPHIYKEGVTEYLERRLAEIVYSLWTEPWEADGPFDSVVIDTSPMLRGISRVVLNLHERLKDTESRHKMRSALSVHGKAIFVSSADAQDVVDLGRALDELLVPGCAPADSTKSQGRGGPVVRPETALVVLNRVPRSAVVKGPPSKKKSATDGPYFLKNDPSVREYFHAFLKSLLSPRSDLFKPVRRKGLGQTKAYTTVDFLENADKSFIIPHDSELAETFLGVMHNRKLMYGLPKEVPELERLFQEVCKHPS